MSPLSVIVPVGLDAENSKVLVVNVFPLSRMGEDYKVTTADAYLVYCVSGTVLGTLQNQSN